MVAFLIVVVLLTLAAILWNPPWRRRVFSDRIFAAYRKMVPPMSQTEREALGAGTVWWEGELFGGRPDWNKLLAYPKPQLSATEQTFLDGPVEALCAMLDEWKISHEWLDLPPQAWQFIRDNGFLGMIIPKRYGGLEFSALAHSEVVMKISTRSNAAAVSVMVPNSLGPAELLLHYGTGQQKEHYLPRLASGIDIPCFALTGPHAGSDAGAIPDTGIVCYGEFEGRGNVLGIRLTWEKRYITLAPVATLLGLAFKLRDPDRLIGGEESLGITLALIPTATKGVVIGRRHFPLNAAFQNGPTSGNDVFVPLEWVIGGRDGIGQGWRMLMESLAAGRSISLPAQSVAAAKLAARTTGAYARIRTQFNLPIGRFEGVAEALARIGGNTYLMDAARCMTAGAVDLGEKPSVPSAIVKYHLTEGMRSVLNDAMDIHGGKGICLGPNNYLGRAYQQAPVAITVEGANILTRSLIIFGQGAIRCHPWVLKEMQAAGDEDFERGAAAFDPVFWAHVRFFLSNLGRSLMLGVTGGKLTDVPGPLQTRRYYQQLGRFAAALALLSDAAMLVLGGELKRKENLSARLGDVLSQLYLSSATLKRFEDQGRPHDDLPLLTWALHSAFFKMQVALDGVLANFPLRSLAWILRRFVFPKGLTLTPPTDAMGHAVAQLLLAPSKARDRLTTGIYIPPGDREIVGRLEVALEAVIEADTIKAAMAKQRGAMAKQQAAMDRQHPAQPGERQRATAGAATDALPAAEAAEGSCLMDGQVDGQVEAAAIAVAARAQALTRAVIDVDDFAPEDLRRATPH